LGTNIKRKMTSLRVTRILKIARQHVWAIIGAVVSGALVIISNLSGVGWSWDSTDYVEVGRNIAMGKGDLDVIGRPMTVRPPGFSALIALGDWCGLSPDSAILLINILSAVIVTSCSYILLRRATRSTFSTAVGTLFIAFAPALLWQYSMAWSEPPFLAIEMLALTVALFGKNRWKHLLLCGLLAALFFMRYVGPVFSAAIILTSVVTDTKTLRLFRAIAINAAVLIVSLVPAYLWLARNHRIDGTFTGTRQAGGGTFVHALATIPATVGMWIVGRPYDSVVYESWSSYPMVARLAAVLVGLGAACLAIVFGFRVARGNDRPTSTELAVAIGATGVLVFYSVFSAYRFVHWELGLLDSRMMIPLYAPIVILLVIVFDSGLRNMRVARTATAVLVVVLLVFHASVSLKDAWRFGKDGRHMASRSLIDTALNRFLKTLPGDSGYVSNKPIELYSVLRAGPIFGVYNMDDKRPSPCARRFVVWYKAFVIQDNKPDTLAVIYDDEIGTVFDAGTCDTDINEIWP